MEELYSKIDKVSEKLDKMAEVMVTIQVSQGKTEVNVEEHMRRTSLAEENIAILRKEIEPIKQHVTKVESITKFAKWILGGIGALILAIIAHSRK